MKSMEAEIGKRIRRLRKAQGLTMKELADKAGFSQGYISKLENSESAPPISTLIRLAQALNVDINAFFGEQQDQATISLVKRDERRELAREGTRFGYSYEMLAPAFMNKKMDPYILIIPPDMKTQPFFQHEGQEMVFILEGEGTFTYGDKEIKVEAGDCLYFEAGVQHVGTNTSGKEFKALIVIWSP